MGAEVVKGGEVASSEVADVDVVADGSSIRGGKVYGELAMRMIERRAKVKSRKDEDS